MNFLSRATLIICLSFTFLTMYAQHDSIPTKREIAPRPFPMPAGDPEYQLDEELPLADLWMIDLMDNQEDPGYATYKEGYKLILDEQWAVARKKFADVISKYPKSEYIDDAEYWSAYAMKHINRKKAAEEYDRFVKEHPSSNYYDDAVADLANLAVDDNIPPNSLISGSDKIFTIKTPRGVNVRAPMPNMRALQHNLRRMERGLRAMPPHMATPAIAPMPSMNPFVEEKLDPGTRLKMDALYALGQKEDEKAYQTLKEVALDQKQPRPLREAAIQSLSDFRKFDVLPVYMEIAKKDTNEEVQNSAIEYIGQLGKDKNKSVETLAELFSTVPRQRTGQLETILFTVADIGNDKAVDFLTKVARTHENYDLRTDAVYYLGNIGGDKARAALYDILKGK